MARDVRGRLVEIHGMTNTPTWGSWRAMRKRCSLPTDHAYKNYGGRGIGYDPAWDDFQKFFDDMGERPAGKTLERMDVNGDYTKDNCCWATYKEQGNNTRKNVFLELGGEKLTITQWAERLGVSPTAIGNRLRKGLSVEATLTTAFKTTTLTIDGVTRGISEWADIAGVNRNTITDRLKRMSEYEAVFAPRVVDKSLKTLVDGEAVALKDLAQHLGVSVMTIRRDIEKGLCGDDIMQKRYKARAGSQVDGVDL